MAETAYEIQTVDRLIAVLNQGDEGAEATRLYREIMDRLATNIQEHGGGSSGAGTRGMTYFRALRKHEEALRLHRGQRDAGRRLRDAMTAQLRRENVARERTARRGHATAGDLPLFVGNAV